MSNKRNLVLYIDEELVEKTRELGFNLSNTFENHLKHLITHFSEVNSVEKCDSVVKGFGLDKLSFMQSVTSEEKRL